MKKTVDKEEFFEWFAEYRPNNFSHEGRYALYDMLTEYEEDTGEELEFDPIAFCCEYSEYADIEEFWEEYDKKDYPDEQSIMDATVYYSFKSLYGNSFIIQKF